MTLTPQHRLIAGFALIAILGALLVWKHVHDRNISNQGTGVSSLSPVPPISPAVSPTPEPIAIPSPSQTAAHKNQAHNKQKVTEIVDGALRTPKKIPSQVRVPERQEAPKLLPESSNTQVATGQPYPTPRKATTASASTSSGKAESNRASLQAYESNRARQQAYESARASQQAYESDRARQQAHESERARQQANESARASQQAYESVRQQAESARASQQAESERASQQADKEKTELRAQLLQQLNTILATRDTARGLVANMSDVLFKTGSYELSPGVRERLGRVSGIIAAHPGLYVEIEGYTDSVGNDEYNQQLSEERAIAVREYLIQHGIPANVIVVRGLSKTNPVATNDTSEGRQQNRRAELILSGNPIDPNPKPVFGTATAPK